MENVYKVRVKTNPPPLSAYPSERRYSASTVLGLGVVHVALAATTLLLASLILSTSKEIVLSSDFGDNRTLQENGTSEGTTTSEVLLEDQNATNGAKSDLGGYNYYTNLSVGPCVMTLGSLLAGLSALLAWKRWYIDNNIKWFFISSCISTLTSLICLLLTAFTVSSAGEFRSTQFSQDFPGEGSNPPSFSLVAAVNILIASASEVIWSVLSARLAYKGMMNGYPEDIIISKSGGRTEVCTVRKGNRKRKIIPPDILNHFPNSGKLAKYLPKMESGDLPKEESNKEYRERVNKFLAAQNNADAAQQD